jgi:transcriptional regulator with PAS, ATPase and Fis domain
MRIAVTRTAEVEIPDGQPVPGGPPALRRALVIYCGADAAIAELPSDSALVVGRDFPSHVHLDDDGVSRQHARFWVTGATVRVEDLGSRNGTVVNGKRVTAADLVPGDEVRVGSATLILAASRPRLGGDGTAPQGIVMQSPKVIAAYELARRAARVDAPILILGETGTGKEHLATTVHTESPRRVAPFKAINCGAIPEGLTESILFGHERGAFTGADRRAKGLFDEASGGVVFLDEIGELSGPAQKALLRVLETKKMTRVGGSTEVDADARVVAATHCDLARMVDDGTFRADLLYRLNTIVIELPPLRERLDELQPLIDLFLQDVRREWGIDVAGVEPDAMNLLRSYPWPGNIRQLRNVIERAAIVAKEARIRPVDLPHVVFSDTGPVGPDESREPETEISSAGLKPLIRSYEARVISTALRRTGGSRHAAAKLLRIPLRTLFRKLKTLGLE